MVFFQNTVGAAVTVGMENGNQDVVGSNADDKESIIVMSNVRLLSEAVVAEEDGESRGEESTLTSAVVEVETNSEKASANTWEDDDDDDDSTVVASPSSNVLNGTNDQTQVVEVTNSGGDEQQLVVGEEEKKEPTTHNDEEAVVQEVSAVEEKESTSEWSDDDDDDDDTDTVQKASTVQVAGLSDANTITSSESGTVENTAESESGDAGGDLYAFNSENSSTIETGGTEVEKKTEWSDDDDDDDDTAAAVDTLSNNEVGYETADQLGDSTNGIGEEEEPVNDSETNNVDTGANTGNLVLTGEDALAPPTAYHRNQSASKEDEGGVGKEEEGDAADGGGEDEGVSAEENTPEAAAVEAGEITPEGSVGDLDAGADNGSVPNDNMAAGGAGGDANDMATGGNNVDTIPGGENNLIPSEEQGNIVSTEGNPDQGTIPGTEQQPIQNGIGWEEGEGEEDDSFFEMVQSTFNVLFLAAVFTSILVFRKRVMDRLHADPSSSVPKAMMEELVDVIMKLASWVMAKIAARNGGGENGGTSAGGASGGGTTGNSRGNSYGSETIPLSTATDEEWGWEDEETNLELSAGMGGGDGDNAKEDDDLAMAIAMSLSEGPSGDEEKGTPSAFPKTSSNFNSMSAKTINKKPLTPPRPLHTKKFGSSMDKGKIQRASSVTSKTSSLDSAPSSSTASAAGGGDSIEDLLGQMGGANGQMITSFGQKQPKAMAKPKATPKKESSDDIFASMGLSSYPSSNAAAATGGASYNRPAPSSGGWQAPAAKTGAPSSSLFAADALDDADDDSWGDDGDLDDLLED